jgi:hypothetical protein
VGDLGRKEILHEAGDAGTSLCFSRGFSYLSSFGLASGAVAGNHDLEGFAEFGSDEANLGAWVEAAAGSCEMNGAGTPWFSYTLSETHKVRVLGLSTTRFRDAEHSSHEIYVGPEQLAWFEREVARFPAAGGWRVVVVSHAPPLGCGLRVIRGVHLKNGCAFLNHSGPIARARKFMEIVRASPQVACWFSGHYHLSHDHEDSVTHVPGTGCVFVQCGVIGGGSSRDGRRQSRIADLDVENGEVRIYSVNHHLGEGERGPRLDATFDLETRELTKIAAEGGEGAEGDWVQT